MDRLTFQIPSQQHKEWFIATLLPHIKLPMVQQKLASPAEALEETTRMEASLVGESSTGMAQVQSQLATLTLHLQDISKMKENMDDVWCTYCKVEDHFKNQCPILLQYMAIGAPNPVGQGDGACCEIYRSRGHIPKNFHIL